MEVIMLESVINTEETSTLDAQQSIDFCLSRLNFIADGLQTNDMTIDGMMGASICIKDVVLELKNIQKLLDVKQHSTE